MKIENFLLLFVKDKNMQHLTSLNQSHLTVNNLIDNTRRIRRIQIQESAHHWGQAEETASRRLPANATLRSYKQGVWCVYKGEQRITWHHGTSSGGLLYRCLWGGEARKETHGQEMAMLLLRETCAHGWRWIFPLYGLLPLMYYHPVFT